MRDDFNEKAKDILSQRVGQRCSNPNCRKLTGGPKTDNNGAINIGVAAHITAASKNGPRFDENISSEYRSSIENGIWLCQNCAKLVDNDEIRYTKDVLIEWKRLSEQASLLEVESLELPKVMIETDDIDLIRFYSQCFDRPAFQDVFIEEGSMEAFEQAIEDTIIAVNTGTLLSRDGTILAQAKGKSFIFNISWRKKMDVIVDLLRAIRSRYSCAIQTGQIRIVREHDGVQWYHIKDRKIAEWMDETRYEIIEIFSDICRESGIAILTFPRIWRNKY